jgi:hypothetical protein
MPTLDARYQINGLIDTNQSALDNMTAIVNSCNTWLSYDALVGKWAVVINQAGSSEYSFDDSNIIGGIKLNTTDLDNLYNSVEVRFHNTLLRDKEDYILLEIPLVQRLPNEPPRRLTINAPLVNNQIQAQLIGLIELKQSRLDKVIQFQTDFSYINIEAGTIISVTNTVYGWTSKLFRVLQMSEQETNGTIVIEFTAQEYSSDIYDETDLYEYLRPTQDGLIELDPLTDVSAITPSSAVVDSSGNSLLGLLGANTLIALLKGLMEDGNSGVGSIFKKIFDVFDTTTGKNLITSSASTPTYFTVAEATVLSKLQAMNTGMTPETGFDFDYRDDRANWISISLAVPAGISVLDIDIKTPTMQMDFEGYDQTDTIRTFPIIAQPAFNIVCLRGATLAAATVVSQQTIDWNSNYSKLVVQSPPADTYWIVGVLIETYDLTQWWDRPSNPAAKNALYFDNFAVIGSPSSDMSFVVNQIIN